MYGAYLQGDMLQRFVERTLQDQNEVNRAYEEVLGQKALEQMKSQVTIMENEVSVEEMDKIMADIRAEQEKKQEEAQAKRLAATVETAAEQKEEEREGSGDRDGDDPERAGDDRAEGGPGEPRFPDHHYKGQPMPHITLRCLSSKTAQEKAEQKARAPHRLQGRPEGPQLLPQGRREGPDHHRQGRRRSWRSWA